MGPRVRAVALAAILAVLLGGIALTLWRGDPLTPELMTPLGLITALLVWSEKQGGGRKRVEGDEDQDEEDDDGGDGPAGALPRGKKGGGPGGSE